MEQEQRPRPALSVIEGVSIMVGIVIGIGIFKTPALVAANVGSEAAFAGVWLLGGLVTLVGALCYAELASAFPSSGGEYHFIGRAFGQRLATLFGWARATVIQTGAIAAVAFVLGDYAAQIYPLGENGPALYAALSIFALTAINISGTGQGKATQVVLTFLTLSALLSVIAAAFLAPGSAEPAAPTAGASSSGSFGLAMILVLLTYGGWNEAAYLSAEMRERRDIVRMLVAGTIVLTALYLAVNLAFLTTFGLEGLRRSDAPGAQLMRLAVGDAGALLLSACVVATALSTLNGTIFTGARTYYALGRDIPVFARLGVWDPRGENPRNGLILQGAIALALVALGSVTRDGFQAMVDYTAPVFWTFLLLTGASLFVLRRREPERERPFRVPLYPVTPLIFCATCGYMLYASIAYTGFGGLIGLAVLATGLPLVFFQTRKAAPDAAATPSRAAERNRA